MTQSLQFALMTSHLSMQSFIPASGLQSPKHSFHADVQPATVVAGGNADAPTMTNRPAANTAGPNQYRPCVISDPPSKAVSGRVKQTEHPAVQLVANSPHAAPAP